MENNKVITFVFILQMLLSCFNAKDWQGYGNMSSSNLTEIWGFINEHIATAVAQDSF